MTVPKPLPGGFVPIPVHFNETQCTLPVCVIARTTPDPVSGHLVILDEFSGARVYLGCLCDQNQRVTDWLEIWVQASPAEHPSTFAQHTNGELDREWAGMLTAMNGLPNPEQVESAYSQGNTSPTYLDIAERIPVHPVSHAMARMSVCRDDARLIAQGLPPYSASRERFLWDGIGEAKNSFVPLITSETGENFQAALSSFLPPNPSLVPFNPHGGYILLRKHLPLTLDEFSDLLAGKSWAGTPNTATPLPIAPQYAGFASEDKVRSGIGHLFSNRATPADRVLEILHLKLHLLHDACTAVQDYVRETQLPMLNLAPDSFRVEVGNASTGLPSLWNFRLALNRPGRGMGVDIPGTVERFYRTMSATGASVFLPENVGVPPGGRGTARILKVLPPVEDGVAVEFRLSSDDVPRLRQHDLIKVHLPSTAGSFDLYAFIDQTHPPVRDEVLCRTTPAKLSPATVTQLGAMVGVPLTVTVDVYPPLGPACDLYSCAVIGARILLSKENRPVAYAVDSLMTLAQALAADSSKDLPLSDRIAGIMNSDPKWLEALGPGLLFYPASASQTEPWTIPGGLWPRILAELLKWFPGLVPESYRANYGDHPRIGLHQVFDPAIEQLGELLDITRATISLEWHENAEVRGILESVRESLP